MVLALSGRPRRRHYAVPRGVGSRTKSSGQLPMPDDLKTRTISDFGRQWTNFRDNPGYYGSIEFLSDFFGPLLSVEAIHGLCIADIGSGTGRIVGMLLDAGARHVIAVEPSAAMSVLKENTTSPPRRDHLTSTTAAKPCHGDSAPSLFPSAYCAIFPTRYRFCGRPTMRCGRAHNC